MMREYILDARALEPPEPFDRACGILQNMQQGEYLRMVHRRMPYPLFDFCRDHGFSYHIVRQTGAECELIIFADCDLRLLESEGLL